MCLTLQQLNCLFRTSIDCSRGFWELVSKSFHPHLPCFTECLKKKRKSLCFLDLYLKKAKHLTYTLKWKCRWNLKFFSSLCIPSGHNIMCGFNIKFCLRSKFKLKPLPIYVHTQKNMLSMRKWPYCFKILFKCPFVKDVILCNRKWIN